MAELQSKFLLLADLINALLKNVRAFQELSDKRKSILRG
jgi:HIRAN domain